MTVSNVEEQRITEVLEENYMPYVMSVIMSRAIPEIDGFKPAHRKLLYTMYKMNLLGESRTKSANVVGQTMKLNPHGDQAIYATMVRMSRGYDALLHPYVDSKGNFGKHTSRDMACAASRYTEVRLSPICKELFRDIDKNTVTFVDNYDGKLKEPRLLPTSFPNVLIHANKGIAVGMASSICSFNLEEVCHLTKAYLKDESVQVEDFITGPDFSTGGYLIKDQEQLRRIYKTGRGSFFLQAVYTYNPKDNAIEITEIPYTTTVEAIMDKILQQIQGGKIKEIQDMRDETDLKGLKLTLDLKRGTDPEKLIQKLFATTPLRDSFSCNFNVLVDGKPKVLGIKPILREWVLFRTQCLQNYLGYMVEQKEKKLHLLLGLDRVLLDIDRAIRIIRETESDDLVISNLMGSFHIDQIQAEFVADIKLRNLNRQYLLEKTKEIVSLRDDIDDMKFKMQSDRALKRMISEDLDEVLKKYAAPRKTRILDQVEVVQYQEDKEIDNYNLKIFVTEHGYIKKIPLVSLRTANNHKLKEEDEIMFEMDGENKSEFFCFTNKQNVYKIWAYELKDEKASSLGQYAQNVFDMEEDEQIVFAHLTQDYKGHFLFVYENGKVAKVPVESYQTKSNRRKLVNGFHGNSPLIQAYFLPETRYLLLERWYKKEPERTLVVSTDLISEKTTRSTQGIQVIRLKKNSHIGEVALLEQSEETIGEFLAEVIPSAGQAGTLFRETEKSQLDLFDLSQEEKEEQEEPYEEESEEMQIHIQEDYEEE